MGLRFGLNSTSSEGGSWVCGIYLRKVREVHEHIQGNGWGKHMIVLFDILKLKLEE